jgi:tetratricopeptide (TPR) repeat protein
VNALLLALALAATPSPAAELLPTADQAALQAAGELTRDYATAESEHFLVAMPKGKDEVLAPYLLETLELQRAALEQDLGAVSPGKVRVEIYANVGELARVSTLAEAEIRASGTIAICRYGKLMMVSPKALFTGYDWLDTAAHELTHQVVELKAPRTPIWLHEGIAKWEETRWRGAGGQAFSPYSAALLRRAVESKSLITFEQMHPSMAKLPTQEQAALAFAEVVMAVELMVQRGGPQVLSKVLTLVAGGTAADTAVAVTLGMSWNDFLAAWKQHLATRPLPPGGAQALSQLRFKDDPKRGGAWAEWAELPDEQARRFARLGELMRERGRWVAARVEYQKAIDKAGGPKVAILAVQFAVAAVQSGQPAEAERVVREALRWNAGSPALHVQLARRLAERKEHAAVKEQLLLANRQDPFDPEIHAGLAVALEALGDAAGASRERRFAEILQPRGHAPP